MKEFWVGINKEKWIKEIESLKAKGKSTREELKKAIVDAVKKRIPKKKFGIMFSGGVDSSLIALICKQANADFICYTIGYGETARDVEWAKKVAKDLGLNLKIKILSFDEAKKYIVKTAKLLGEIERPVVHAGVGAVVMAAADLAKKDKVNILFGGLGSEEIFAGYERHKGKNINDECWFGLKRMIEGDLKRDFLVSKEMKINVLTPFLDKEVIKTAMKIPGSKKMNKEYKKVILREIAEELGLSKEFAWRKKKAAQYGSRLDKAIKKLAGKQQKGDYLKSLI